jgi:ABC-type spermidine/putrescine transport system permease subunit II
MKENFINSMLSEGGKVSHKRFISVLISIVVAAGSAWTIYRYPQYIPDTIHSLLIFICIMSGVATVAQVVSLFRGGPVKDDKTDHP